MAQPTASGAPSPGAPRQARRHVLLRVLAATFGNYALTALATAWLARALALALHPAEASSLATMLSFALFATLVIVVFAVRNVGPLCLLLGTAGASLVMLLWLGLPGAGGPL